MISIVVQMVQMVQMAQTVEMAQTVRMVRMAGGLTLPMVAMLRLAQGCNTQTTPRT